jgi:signal transduction histidine kinase
MSVHGTNRWFWAAAGVTLLVAIVSFVAPPGYALTAFADGLGVVLMLIAAGALLANAISRPVSERPFWLLLALGMVCWTVNNWAWLYSQVVLGQELPNPHYSDVILFFHPVPFIAAVAWRADRVGSFRRSRLGMLSVLMLLAWWMFLYAFMVFPAGYVVFDLEKYDNNYLLLYAVENLMLVAVLAWAQMDARGPWKRLYRHLLAASVIYALSQPIIDLADMAGKYYSGCPYDIVLTIGVAWIAAVALSVSQFGLEQAQLDVEEPLKHSPTLDVAMSLTVLSLPVLGLWTYLWDHSPVAVRLARVGTVLAAMALLGLCVFLRHYLQDQALIELLQDSRRSYESQERLQRELVQKEKLAALGQAVSGTAREMDVPLAGILSAADQMWSGQRLSPEQDTLVRKIAAQGERTRGLVSDLLRFAQQSSEEKVKVDLCALLQRSVQLLELQRLDGGIRIEMYVDPNGIEVLGNAKQLFQAFAQIVDNAVDVLEESGGGSLQVMTQREGDDVLILFSDSGPGIREPHRVFDPFYTTKAIGKGTGLGLSAVYGTVQEHGGQITCQNKPDGGALFIIRLPARPAALAVAAKA